MSRRSSLILSQAVKDGALDDLRELNIRDFPPALTANAARHSTSFQMSRGSSAHASFIPPDSLNPTPLQQRRPITAPSCSTTSANRFSTLQPLSEQRKAQLFRSNSTVGSTGATSFRPSIPTASSKNSSLSKSSNRIPSNSYRRMGESRSRSMESLWMTPGMTPNSESFQNGIGPDSLQTCRVIPIPKIKNPTLPSDFRPLSPYTEARVGGSLGNTLKPPSSQDKQELNEIFLKVHDFLQRHEFPNLRPAKKVGGVTVTVTEYLNMCRFSVQVMMGSGFLCSLKPDDLTSKLLEISISMKYPGTLTKSIFKTPNTPHSWPAALTFLAWLCYTADNAMTPIIFKRELDLLVDAKQHITDIACELHIALFFQNISTGNIQLEEALLEYEKSIMEVYGIDESTTLDDLIEIKNEKYRQLHLKGQLPDPRKELLYSIHDRYQAIRHLDAKETELLGLENKFTDLQQVRYRTKALSTAIRNVETSLKSLDELIAEQEMDKEKEKSLLNETGKLKKQRDTLEQININTAYQLDKREQHGNNLNSRFYATCSRLNISDVFNDILQKLELLKTVKEMERIPKIPFTPSEIKIWLKKAVRIKKQTRTILLELDEIMGNRIEKAERTAIDNDLNTLDYMKTIQDNELEMGNMEQQNEQLIKHHESEMNICMEEISTCTSKMLELENLNQHREADIELICKNITDMEASESALTCDLRECGDEAVKLELEFKDAETDCENQLRLRIAHCTEVTALYTKTDEDDEDDEDDQ